MAHSMLEAALSSNVPKPRSTSHATSVCAVRPTNYHFDRLRVHKDVESARRNAHTTRLQATANANPPAAEGIDIFVLATRAENAARVYGGTFCR